MTLLSQVLAVVVAAALIAWRLRARGAPSGIGATAVLAVGAVLTFFALGTLWAEAHGVWVQRKNASRITPGAALVSPGAGAGANVPFVEWLDRNLPRDASFYFSSGPNGARDPANYQWATYRLYPRAAVDDVTKADWVILHATTITKAGYKRSDFTRVLRFDDKLMLAERRR
jgi:hypothetical protein